MIRFDWMQDMLEWFDYYLKGIGDQPGQWIEIQSNQGSWRIEDRYPPADANELVFELGAGMINIAGTTTVLPDASSGPIWETEPLTEDMHIAGMPRVHVESPPPAWVGNCTRCSRIVITKAIAFISAMPSWICAIMQVAMTYRRGRPSLNPSMRKWNSSPWMPRCQLGTSCV